MLETGLQGDRRPLQGALGQMAQEGAGRHTQDDPTRSAWQAGSSERSPQRGRPLPAQQDPTV